jgi:hypothetical protein
MKNLTSLEAKIQKFAKSNNMKTNDYEWGKMTGAVEDLVSRIERYKHLSSNELNRLMDIYFKGFKNPENWAMREEAVEDLKILGFKFINNHDLYRK